MSKEDTLWWSEKVFKELSRQKECEILEGHLMPIMFTCWCPYLPNTRYRKSSAILCG